MEKSKIKTTIDSFAETEEGAIEYLQVMCREYSQLESYGL